MKVRLSLAAIAWMVAATSTFAQNQMLDALKDRLNSSNSSNSSNSTNSPAGSGTASPNTAGAGAAMASGLGIAMPKIGASSMGNVAGVLQYCMQNNYLKQDAGGVKDKLLGMVSGQKPQQTSYANGAKGLLQGSDGKSLNMKNLSGQLKTKACDYVLANAKSLV